MAQNTELAIGARGAGAGFGRGTHDAAWSGVRRK
jgi:hypothetical protein